MLNSTWKNVENRNRERQKGTSIYLLLWAVFSVLALAIVITVSVALTTVIGHSYKEEAESDVRQKGADIRLIVTAPPPSSFNNMSDYVRYLNTSYDVDIYILDLDGNVMYPERLDYELPKDFPVRVVELKTNLEGAGTRSVVYERPNAFVYGAQITLYDYRDEPVYLYVEKSLQLVQAAEEQIFVRSVILGAGVFLIAFIVSSALSRLLTRPILEITEKAKTFAKGNFEVDFRGTVYNKEMNELAVAFNYARDEISKADTMQKELIANVSHDFKTPLTMIKAYASMIVEISGDIKEKREQHAQVIVDEADRLASLVGDILDLSKLQSGLQELKKTVVDMSAYVQETVDRFDYLRETQGYTFDLDVDEGLFAYVDEIKIGQVLYNLIGNAVNYTGEDKKVVVSLKTTGEKTFRFSVRDSGKGIKQEDIPTIWQRYYRSAESHKRPVRGTGLGLSIVKAVLLKHELNFGVDSEVGKGSTFYVDFAAADDE